MTRDELLRRLVDTDRRTRQMIDGLSPEQLSVPYERGINPPIWEIGHAVFFYEIFLLRRLYGIEPIMPGQDPMWDSADIPHRERWTPGVVPEKEVTLGYYDEVMRQVEGRLSGQEGLCDETLYLAQYCIAHHCMHLESLIWCRQTLGFAPPPFLETLPDGLDPTRPIQPEDVTIPADRYFIGVPSQKPGSKSSPFSFDNERPGFEIDLPEFAISRTLVSQGEFLEFVEDGGYVQPEHWSFGGQYWLRQTGLKSPAYWSQDNGDWLVRRFDQTMPLHPACPVIHLSFWEAEAYCHWAGRRLPTEFEWEVAARGGDGIQRPFAEDVSESPVDLDGRFLGTAPVDAFPDQASPFGCLQMLGSAWEWTSSQYLPFDGFCADMYVYMSTLQFGDHKTTRGGSGATSCSLIRNTYRQAYFPDRTDVFTGFRTCAIS